MPKFLGIFSFWAFSWGGGGVLGVFFKFLVT